jgi:glycosyltransferase involved in cell wall biosynthesis
VPDKATYNYNVFYPRFAYILPKKLFKYTVSSWSFNRAVIQTLEANQFNPDMLHAGHIHFDGYAVAKYAKRNNIPFTVTSHGTLLHNYHSYGPKAKRVIEAVIEKADSVFCVSEELVEIAGTITNPKKVHLVPIGADPDRFPIDKRAELRAEYKMSQDVRVVLFCGRCSRQKGVGDLIKMLPTIRDRGAELVVISDGGGMRDDLKRAIKRTDMEDSTRLLWNLDPADVAKWFTIADLLVLPSQSEGRPTVIYEAMASETPVIAYRVGGIPEQVADGRTGILIPAFNYERFERELDRVLSEPEELDRIGPEARKYLIESGWTWESHAKNIMQHHHELMY